MKTKAKLTERQQEIYDFIKESTLKSNMPPTVREIGDHFNISSTNGVRSVLAVLIKKGYINRTPRLSRGIEIIETPIKNNPEPLILEVPIVGSAAAGEPILAVQNIEGTVTVDRDFLANRKDVFALHVKGDSMINAGIFNGDLIFAKEQKTDRKSTRLNSSHVRISYAVFCLKKKKKKKNTHQKNFKKHKKVYERQNVRYTVSVIYVM